MTKILILLIVHCSFLIFNCYAQQYGWVNIGDHLPNTVSTATITDIAMSGDSMWITSGYGNYQNGVPGEIYFSSDRGNTFSIQTTLYGINSIKMVDSQRGFCGGAEGQVYRTTNGGAVWIRIGSLSSTVTEVTAPPGSDTGYVIGDNGIIKRITSTGLESMQSGTSNSMQSISAPSSNHIYAAWWNSVLFSDGITWVDQQTTIATTLGIYIISICMVTDSIGWLTGSFGLIAKTLTAGWDTNEQCGWLQQDCITGNFSFQKIRFSDLNNGIACGSMGMLVRTTDGGTTWALEAEGMTNGLLNSCFVINENEAYVVGNNSVILKYGLLTDVEQQPTQPTEFKLEQNYPNPFNPVTTIRYTIPTPPSSSPLAKGRNEVGFVTLKVYDVLGNEVATLVNEEKPSGTYEVEFNSLSHSRKSGNLTSGIYFYQLKAGNYLETKKMILIK